MSASVSTSMMKQFPSHSGIYSMYVSFRADKCQPVQHHAKFTYWQQCSQTTFAKSICEFRCFMMEAACALLHVLCMPRPICVLVHRLQIVLSKQMGLTIRMVCQVPSVKVCMSHAHVTRLHFNITYVAMATMALSNVIDQYLYTTCCNSFCAGIFLGHILPI